MTVDGGIHVHAIGDQFDGDPLIFQKRNDRARLTTVDRTHRIEQMRTHRCARRDRRPRLLIGRLGVANGSHHASADDLADRRERAITLRSEGDHSNGPSTRIQHAVDLGGIRVTHQGRLVSAAPLRGKPRTFEVDPVDHAGMNGVGQRRDLAQYLVGAGGNQGSDECCGAVAAVQFHRGRRVGHRSVGEIRPSAAVQMRVDEARHHRRRAEIPIRGPGRCPCADRIHNTL